jgi:thiosulfate/3-mercaptopyruvate sulfurtransferase
VKKFVIILITALTVASVGSLTHASSDDIIQYISSSDVKNRIQNGTPMIILDIQVKAEFDQHHITGALATYAYPVKSDADKTKLDLVMEKLGTNGDPLVIVCPRGGGGAKRTWQYLSSKGISTDRMYILENGQGGWPYPELLASN